MILQGNAHEITEYDSTLYLSFPIGLLQNGLKNTATEMLFQKPLLHCLLSAVERVYSVTMVLSYTILI